ncbi:MAG: glycosyltransferase family 4 protein [Patescibacteria group bacterium]|nr:glycosyltransferase family 4 protein [Patescibacteria group bacterium]
MMTPYVPYPPSSGGQIRTFNLLKYLCQKNEITLICLYKSEQEKNYQKYLAPYCQEIYFCQRPEKPWQLTTILKSILSRKPFLVIRNFSSQAKKTLEELFKKKKFDVIHLETFYVMPHLPTTKKPVLLVEQTIEYKVYQHFINNLFFPIKIFFMIDILKLKYWEKYYWKKASLVATVSETDQKEVIKLEPQIEPVIIPNGAGDKMIVKKLKTRNLKKPIFLFLGNFLWLQNTEAAYFLIKKIYPLLKKELTNFKIIIAGQNASEKLKNIALDNQIEIIDITTGNDYLVKTLYQKATLFIAPIFGPGGTRLKILAAMGNGLPVISTKTGVEGLKLSNYQSVLLANTAIKFVKQIKKIIKNKTLYQQIQKNAHQLILKEYNWKKIANNLESVYKKLIKL